MKSFVEKKFTKILRKTEGLFLVAFLCFCILNLFQVVMAFIPVRNSRMSKQVNGFQRSLFPLRKFHTQCKSYNGMKALTRSSTLNWFSTFSKLDTNQDRNPNGPYSQRIFRNTRLQMSVGTTSSSLSTSAKMTSFEDLLDYNPKQQLVFFGGKGGVGKTTSAASMAVTLADAGYRTLVISTDPAHSLADSLDYNIHGGDPIPIPMCENLWAMEVDSVKALQKFQKLLKEVNIEQLAKKFGIGEEFLADLGLEDFFEIINNPPPGIDELVALADVINLSRGGSNDPNLPMFDRIVIDTAPTGHTLRLLSFPDFLDGFLGKILKFQQKVTNLLSTFQGVFGGSISDQSKEEKSLLETTQDVFDKIEKARIQMVELQQLLRDHSSTEFVIVTIPTKLAVAESTRLLDSLIKENINVKRIIVNRVLDDQHQHESKYVNTMIQGQNRILTKIKQMIESNPRRQNIKVTELPYFDVEVRGIYGLLYMGNTAYSNDPNNSDDIKEEWEEVLSSSDQKFLIFGGKGGVGKTSTSSSLAVKLAEQGHNTLIVSTDPAHSLGDAFDVNLANGGKLVNIPTVDIGIGSSGSLYALEIDTTEALKEFKGLLQDSTLQNSENGDSTGGGVLDQIKNEFADILESAPPGADELVALTKVIKFLKEGVLNPNEEYNSYLNDDNSFEIENKKRIKFDRIIIDTAPTGHTLRLLSFPEFLDKFLDKVMRIRKKLSGASNMMNMFQNFAGGGTNRNKRNSDGEENLKNEERTDRIKEFQTNMIELKTLFEDQSRTEFVVVTIPTELAATESIKLIDELKTEGISVNHLIINQILNENAGDSYWQQMKKGQEKSMTDINKMLNNAKKENEVGIVPVPFFDNEIRNVYALRYMGSALVKKNEANS